VMLVVAQVVGLNLWSWHQQREVKLKRAEMTTLLKAAHPQVQVILDPAVQMRRETESLRAMAGQPGDNDLEPLMQAVASAWIGEHPSKGLIYDGSSLIVGLPAEWQPTDIEQFRGRMQGSGFAVEQGDGQLTVRRASRG
jgi:general secretion pathway protein L